MSKMLSRTSQKIIDHNLEAIIKNHVQSAQTLEEIVLDLHEFPQLVPYQILNHRSFEPFLFSILRILDFHTPRLPRVAGNAAYVLGALLDTEGRSKVMDCLSDPERVEEVQHCLPNLAALLETFDLEAMTNASGTASVIFETEEGQQWALGQPSCDWLLLTLSRSLLDTDMWVASNCALTLARATTSDQGLVRILGHKESDFILIQLILSLGVDSEGRGMNAAFALAHVADVDAGISRLAEFKECLDLTLGLINMVRSADDGCRKNATFCLKAMSKWSIGQDRIIDDPDIKQLIKLLCVLLTCGDEDLAKMSATIIKNIAQKKDGFVVLRDNAGVKSTLEHVLSQMAISEGYRVEASAALRSIMLDQPQPPMLKVVDAHTIIANWQEAVSKTGAEVTYELICGDEVVYTGPQTSFTVRNLAERTEYEFRVRAYTQENEESLTSDSSTAQTFRAISSPPRDLRAVSVTASQIKIVWEEPSKICGILKGYYVEEAGAALRYEPVYTYHIASNLDPDKEYSFQVCAVTQRGKGETASITVRTLRSDFYAPTKPQLMAIGKHEIVCTWNAPIAPIGRINGYEVLCNGKSVYFGMNKRCMASMLKPGTKYKFVVVAWTSEGRSESEPSYKKTSSAQKKPTKNVKKPWKNKDELMKWLDSTESYDLGDQGATDDDESNAAENVATEKVGQNKKQPNGDQVQTPDSPPRDKTARDRKTPRDKTPRDKTKPTIREKVDGDSDDGGTGSKRYDDFSKEDEGKSEVETADSLANDQENIQFEDEFNESHIEGDQKSLQSEPTSE